MKCVECGAENAEAAPICVHCGAPVLGARQEHSAEPEPVQDSPLEPVGQQGAREHVQRELLVMAGIGLVGLVVIIVVIAAGNSRRQLTIHQSRRGVSQRQLTIDQLRTGDCLTGSDLGLGTSNPWPYQFASVRCTQPHLAEVIFVGNAWPQSLKTYPGVDTIYAEAEARCWDALSAYDGTVYWKSSFVVDEIVPGGGADWGSGDRSLVCVAYKGAPVNYSIKGSRKLAPGPACAPSAAAAA